MWPLVSFTIQQQITFVRKIDEEGQIVGQVEYEMIQLKVPQRRATNLIIF